MQFLSHKAIQTMIVGLLMLLLYIPLDAQTPNPLRAVVRTVDLKAGNTTFVLYPHILNHHPPLPLWNESRDMPIPGTGAIKSAIAQKIR